ncbi:MAG: thiamine-phosphate kinase [Promethearchaeota archaeon]
MRVQELGETQLIKIIEKKVLEKTSKPLIRDDAFIFEQILETPEEVLILNTDMFVSTTDAPTQMSTFQMGRKAILMNISDLIVKGVIPMAVIVSIGIPSKMTVKDFESFIDGIVQCCVDWNIDYLGGDINKTKEIITNPTVFGLIKPSKMISRKGAKPGDFLAINGKFGLTGVGFDILLNKSHLFEKLHSKYEKAISSVLEPNICKIEALTLSEHQLASSSIDSSDGLARSLRELMRSNPKIGFNIELNDNVVDQVAIEYSSEFDIPIEELIFNAGEEFIHIFTINPKNLEDAIQEVKKAGGNLLVIGKVTSTEEIIYIKNEKEYKLKLKGFEHFT